MVCSSATQNLPKHETNFFVPPPHCSKPSLHEQPPFLLAMLSNNWKKQPRLFGGQKVSICFVICIFVCKKLYWIHQPHLQLLFHTGEWSKPTHNPPNLSCLIPGVGGWGGSFTCVEQMPILVYWVECWSNIITPSSTRSIAAKSTKTTSSKPHSFWLRYELQGEVSFMGK